MMLNLWKVTWPESVEAGFELRTSQVQSPCALTTPVNTEAG